jgi:hypothetical protein
MVLGYIAPGLHFKQLIKEINAGQFFNYGFTHTAPSICYLEPDQQSYQ